IVKSPGTHHVRRKRLRDHISPAHQIACHLPASFLRQIEGQTKLTSVEVFEEPRMFHAGLAVMEWSNSAARIEALGGFNAHHCGAIIGEDARGCRSGHHPGKVEDFDICEWQVMGHYTMPLFWSAANCCAVKPSSSR